MSVLHYFFRVLLVVEESKNELKAKFMVLRREHFQYLPPFLLGIMTARILEHQKQRTKGDEHLTLLRLSTWRSQRFLLYDSLKWNNFSSRLSPLAALHITV